MRVKRDRRAPAGVVEWIAAHATPLVSPEAGHGFGDMAPIARLVGAAKIVALGEATHGTREFFQLKHRFLEYLVARLGFTVFAIEASQSECRAIDDYVLHGRGDARAALAGVRYWTWNTEEVLSMIEWMRAWNADPGHVAKVRFRGFDMQITAGAHAGVAEFLERVGADPALIAPIGPLAQPPSREGPAHGARVRAGLARIARTFDAHRKAWIARTSADEFARARHDVTILQQATRMAASRSPLGARDRSMADNVVWILNHEPRGARIVLWAHNGHIANRLAAYRNMGSVLRGRFKAGYVNLGFVFARGSFQAMTGESKGHPEVVTVGPPPAGGAGAAFARAGLPLFVLDLRNLPRSGPVRDWFAAAHPVREIGALYDGEKEMSSRQVLPDLYDAVIFVERTTPARPPSRIVPDQPR